MICRVDERLIHGQVVLGWANHFGLNEYVVVDDDLADSEWEQELYELAVPSSARADFLTVTGAARRLAAGRPYSKETILLARGLEAVVALADAGALESIAVNIGGLHHSPDRREILSYVYLSREDLGRLEWLGERGVQVYAQDLPSSPKITLKALIKRGRAAWAR